MPIIVIAKGKSLKTFALLDSGSTTTVLHHSVTDALGVKGSMSSCTITTIHGNKVVPCQEVSFSISSLDCKAQFAVVNGISLVHPDMPRRSFNPSELKRNWPHLVDLNFDSRNTVQATVIVGRDVNRALDVLEVRHPPEGSDGPSAERTVFGWSIVGKIPNQTASAVFSTHISIETSQDNLHELVRRSFEVDALGTSPRIKPLMPAEDQRGLTILESRTKHTGARYQIGLMWKTTGVILPDNFSSAYRRLLSLERKFARDPAMASRYEAVINEYIQLGHARKLKASELPMKSGRHWYLPHLAVEQPSKTRVVFDPSSSHDGICLNDVLLKGPDLLVSLVNLLTTFRVRLIPLSADIEKMYHQVLVEGEEQPFFSFLWRKPGSNAAPDVYVMTVHIFGAISSPATCMYALRRTAVDFGSSFPDVAHLVATNFYVDNYLDSVDTEDEAIKRSEQLTTLLGQGGFRLRKWITSSRPVLGSIPPENRNDPKLDIRFDELPTEKTLGLLWNCNEDSFRFGFKMSSPVVTKRDLLRAISSIFDPLGMLAPIILKARIILKKVWTAGISWDTELPESFIAKWNKWSSALADMETLRIPRCLKTRRDVPLSRTLHCFCDASTKGYGAVMYLRTAYPSGHVDVTFVIGKSRVAPVKFVSVHRLELQAAQLGSRLAASILEPLGLGIDCVAFWSDSQTVLRWLNSKTMKFHVFVANRVADILDVTSASQWRYVATDDNPADDCSRGLYGSVVSVTHRWFAGPKFLSQGEENWPVNIVTPEPESADPEVAGPIVICSLKAHVHLHPIPIFSMTRPPGRNVSE